MSQWSALVEEDLAVAKGPEAKDHHEQWCLLQSVDSTLVHSVVIHWWYSVVVCQRQSFYQVHVDDADQGDWDQKRDEQAVHEANIYLH